MWAANTHRRKGEFLMVVVAAAVVAASEEKVVADTNAYSPCIRPMDAKCDTRSKLSDKILGGHVAEPGSTPWLVSLQDTHYAEPVPFCGGTLLSHTWVLTSASCVSSYQSTYSGIQVVLGEYDMEEMDGFEKYRRVSRITLHPDYDYFTRHADVALLHLAYYVFYTERINILKLPYWTLDGEQGAQGDEEEVGGMVWKFDGNSGEDNGFDVGNQRSDLYMIAGWGRVGETGEPSSVVRVAEVPLVDQAVCHEVYPEFTSDTIICAGNLTHGGLDSCQGDMGGALATYDGYIIGVSTSSVGCGRPGYPGVYTDVRKIIDWICSVTDRWRHLSSDRLISCRHYKMDSPGVE